METLPEIAPEIEMSSQVQTIQAHIESHVAAIDESLAATPVKSSTAAPVEAPVEKTTVEVPTETSTATKTKKKKTPAKVKPLKKHKCPNCVYSSDNKQAYNRHIKRKTKCGVAALTCNNCSAIFKQHDSLYKHQKNYCKKRPAIIAEKSKLTNTSAITAENINAPITVKNDSSTTINNITNNNNNYYILPFGQENLKYITIDDVQTILDANINCINKYVEIVHLNKQHPENFNINVSMYSPEFATQEFIINIIEIWTGINWEPEKTIAFDILIFKKILDLVNKSKDNIDAKLPDKLMEYYRLLNEYEQTLSSATAIIQADLKYRIMRQLNELVLNLYKNRDMILSEHKKAAAKKVAAEKAATAIQTSSKGKDEDENSDETIDVNEYRRHGRENVAASSSDDKSEEGWRSKKSSAAAAAAGSPLSDNEESS